MNKKIQMILGAAALLIILSVAKNVVIQSVLEGSINRLFPVSVRIGGTDVSLIKTSIKLQNLKVLNPNSFSEKQMADIPLVYIDFDPAGLSKGVAHFEEVRLDLKEFVIIKDKDGKLNVDALKPENAKDQTASKDQKLKDDKKVSLKIDKLYLSMDRVLFKDYSLGNDPSIQTFDIHIKDRLFTDIDNPAAIGGVIMMEVIAKTALNKITNLDVAGFKDQAKNLLGQAAQVGGGAGEKVQEATKGLFKLLN